MPDYVKRRMTIIFDTWLERYANDPGEFANLLDENGRPPAGYGERCALYFEKLANELDAAGVLPQAPAKQP